jgi:DNA-binding MurR/RpiR family transcriptional regulator
MRLGQQSCRGHVLRPRQQHQRAGLGNRAEAAGNTDKVAVVVIGFAPYTLVSVETARAAHQARATLIAIADTISAPMAEGADHLLLFEAASSPGFFPSLTGAIAVAQSLAAVAFTLGGASAKRKLEETEGRLAETSQYFVEKG